MQVMMRVENVNILGLDYAVTDYEKASDLIIQQARATKIFKVFALPVHGIVESNTNPDFNKAAKKADMIVPDGHPVRWLMNAWFNAGLKDRVSGPTLTRYVLNKASKHQLSVFLYGGSTETVLLKFKEYITTNFPDLTICGTYREPSANGNTLTTPMLEKAKPHIILVGRGCPKQEIWISNQTYPCVMMGVGAAFSFYSGETKRAPQWMQKNGLEWLYRIIKEPRRLWKRYLITNTYFLMLVLKNFRKFF